jgi:hypothetical protein
MFLENRSELSDWKQEVLGKVTRLLSRRELLRAALTGAAALAGASVLGGGLLRTAAAAPAAGPKPVKTGTFYFPRLLFHVKDETGDMWNTGLVGDAILRKRLVQLTNINASQEAVVVKLSDLSNMCRYPFVFATSEGYFDLPRNEQENLKEFLHRGGFVHADDCVFSRQEARFFNDYVKMINKLFPDNEMKKVPNDHELYHCYFDFPNGCPHMQGMRHGGWGLFEKGTGRIMTYVTSGDLHCGWMCCFFGKQKDEAALRMGINIIIYYLTH